MSEDPDDTLEAFRRLLGALPSGPGGGIELVISQLPAEAAELLRLGAIPHAVDRDVAAVLLPDSAAEAIDRAVAELLRLSFVTSDGTVGTLHDEARRYLLGQWFASRESDPVAWQRFRETNARLAGHYAACRRELAGQAEDAAERSEIYHCLAAGDPAAFGQFRERLDNERLNFRLEACEALIRVVAELEPLLDAGERAWLGYYRGRLLVDQRRYEEAVEALNGQRRDRTAADDPDLTAAILFGLHDAYRGQRNFPYALAAIGEVLDSLGARPDQRHRKLEATRSMAALLLEMRETRKADAMLRELLEAPELATDLPLQARTWNTMGSVHRRLGRPRRALEAYERALQALERAGERFRPMQVYNNIGALHAERAEWEPARESLEHALAIAREAGDLSGEAAALGNLERVYSGLGRDADAVAATERAIELFRTIHDWHSAATLSRNLARRHRRARDNLRRHAAFQQAAELFHLAGEPAEAERCRAEATSGSIRSWGLGRWFAVAGGLSVGVLLLALAAGVVLVMMGYEF